MANTNTKLGYTIFGVLVVVALVVWIFAYGAYQDAQKSKQELSRIGAAGDWKPVSSTTIILRAGMVQAWAVTTSAAAPMVRYDVQSTEAVDTGVVGAPEGDGGKIRLQWNDQVLASSSCYKTGILHAEQLCSINTGAFIVVRDTRRATTAKDGAGAVVGAYLGAKEPLQHMTAENRVTITFYAWQCVYNCR